MLSPIRTALIALALATPGAAFAATTGAPDPFATEVEQKCTAAAADAFRRSQVIVDPSGSESYGIAIVVGRSKELKSRAATICIVDRKTGKVELGSPLGPDVVRVRGPKNQKQDDQGQETGKSKKHDMQNDAQGGKTMNNNSTGGQDDEDGSDDGQ